MPLLQRVLEEDHMDKKLVECVSWIFVGISALPNIDSCKLLGSVEMIEKLSRHLEGSDAIKSNVVWMWSNMLAEEQNHEFCSTLLEKVPIFDLVCYIKVSSN